MTDKYKALREAAAKATPGPWRVSRDGDRLSWWIVTDTPRESNYPITHIGANHDARIQTANAEHIAAASPDVIVSLLSDLDAATARAENAELTANALEAQLDAMTNQAVMLSSRRAVIVDVSASDEVEALRAALEKAERERDDALAYANRKCHRIDHAASITTCLSCADCQRERAEKAERERDALRHDLVFIESLKEKVHSKIDSLEAEVKRLRDAMPSESILRLMDHAFARGEVALFNIGERQAVKDAITRLAAARNNGGK